MSALKLTVVESHTIGNLMQRLVLSGEGLAGDRIPDDFHGLHIKLFFKQTGQTELTLPTLENGKVSWPADALKPIARTYSIFNFDRETQQLTVDFVLHAAPGIACDFARNAKTGDTVGFAGPGPIRLANHQAQNFLIVGDLSAVPAISSIANTLPPLANAHILIELEDISESDVIFENYFPASRHTIHFLKQEFNDATNLIEALSRLEIRSDTQNWSITLAGEHYTVIELRKYFRHRGFNKDWMYAVPYWRHQLNEESYHLERHQVMDT